MATRRTKRRFKSSVTLTLGVLSLLIFIAAIIIIEPEFGGGGGAASDEDPYFVVFASPYPALWVNK